MKVRSYALVFLCSLILSVTSCKMYKQDILLNFDDEFTRQNLSQSIFLLEQNYTIQPNDYLELRVTTNNGEILVDPNFELMQGNMGGMQQGGGGQNQNMNRYLVQQDGRVKFPMVGMTDLSGLTIQNAEAKLQALFDASYKDTFVRLIFSNKRVFVLGGAAGGMVLPLVNENTSLFEVLALAGGVQYGARANTIRIVRGDLKNPQVFMVDLTTISAMQSTIVSIQPGDIIYIEPWRRVFNQGLRDVSPILSLATSLITLFFVFSTL
jgi:polysaccharide export outer membrane protein